MPKVLMQLIGEQLIPNILPVITLKPDVIVAVDTQRTRTVVENMKFWLAEHGARYQLPEEIRVEEAYLPDSRRFFYDAGKECKERLEKYKKEGCDIFVNITGGTKTMAFAALAIAMEMHVPAVYVDSENKQYQCFGAWSQENKEMFGGYPSNRLDVDAIVHCGGYRITGQHLDWREYLPAAYELQKHVQGFKSLAFEEVTPENVLKPLTDESLLKFHDKKEHREHFEFLSSPVMDELTRLGVVEKKNGLFYLPQLLAEEWKDTRSKSVLRKLQFCKNFLVSGWWEVLMAAYLDAQGYRDVRWSVETKLAGAVSDNDVTETDVLACMDNKLVSVSCKFNSREKKQIGELYEHASKTSGMGGALGKPILAIYKGTEVKNAAAEKNKMQVVFGDEVMEVLAESMNRA